ncbi:phosphopantetheine-binding protein [Sodalis sp. dw_96]|uniref:phosphopantetheine-binding protein n=1 Tax=Sodalis sp. dw_96 TaxID=2719794 RepID=UPI001BD3CAE0|nr:phosphopantetheine-binding protein [Sodalis sp. dw_96]
MNDTLATHSVDPISKRLHAMLAYRLGRQDSEIQDHFNLVNELYVDSLDLVEIEIGISETFGVNLSEKEMLAMETVGDLYQIVKAHIIEKQMLGNSITAE